MSAGQGFLIVGGLILAGVGLNPRNPSKRPLIAPEKFEILWGVYALIYVGGCYYILCRRGFLIGEGFFYLIKAKSLSLQTPPRQLAPAKLAGTAGGFNFGGGKLACT